MEQRDEDGTLVAKSKPQQIAAMLEPYRERGLVDHRKTLAISMDYRIPQIIQQPGGRLRVSVAISSAIASAFGHIEKAKMNAEQIVELAEGIIDTSHEDQLSVEDVLLFLKDLLMGKYGKMSSGIDMPAFFEVFERYRDERYRTIKAIRYEEHLTFKSLGDSNRGVDELPLKRKDDPAAMMDMMQTYYSQNSSNE